MNRKRGSTAHSFSLLPTHRPSMMEMLLKGRKIASQSSIHSVHVCGVSPMAIRKKNVTSMLPFKINLMPGEVMG